MKALFFSFLLAMLPLAFGFWVNETAPHAPTKTYVPTRCTRYCTAHGCRHATRANSPVYFRLRPLYVATVAGLAAGGWGLYAVANIALYLIFIPGLLMWLTYGALRNMQTIRQLKTQP
ncbi:MAG: hypothetical protein ACRYFZ_09200 [Janthinobacterium lividum]